MLRKSKINCTISDREKKYYIVFSDARHHDLSKIFDEKQQPNSDTNAKSFDILAAKSCLVEF